MTHNDKQPPKKEQLEEKLAAEETKQIARYQVINKADLIREEAIQKTSNAKEIKRTEKRTADDIEQSTRYLTIRKADLAREQAIADGQKATKLSTKK